MPLRYPRHLPGFSYTGLHQYSLTFCTESRAAIFTNADTVTLVLTQIQRAAIEESIAIVAYCFMPDHLHLIIEGTAAHSGLKDFIHRAKQYSAFYYKRQVGSRLWQRYGYEHVIRDRERLGALVRYVLENPVRAGLVKEPRDYAFLGSSVYTLEALLEFAYDRGRSSG